ncbi:hypothetical protein [Nocardia wallacei]|uniref:hypothetical protein n=1 Tax=Nocardia wallacei TaxID=480035 RepID=UPI002455EA9B|nr:hypothetical protein [Nocardia wallacei]
MGDSEDRDNGIWAGDLDFGDEGGDECFAGLIAARGDDCGDVVGDIGENGWVRDDWGLVDSGDEFVAACGELSAGVAQFGES